MARERGAEAAHLRYLAALAGADVVLASYEAMEQENKRVAADDRPGLLQAVWWHRAVLDEIQLLENKSDVARTASEQRALRDRAEAGHALQAAHRWCVSGTPLATPEDVVAVLRFLRQQPFAEDELGPTSHSCQHCRETSLGVSG